MHYLIPENIHFVRRNFSMNLLTIIWANPLKDRLVSALSVRDLTSDVDARLHAANHVLVHVDLQHRHQRSNDSHPWGFENDDDDDDDDSKTSFSVQAVLSEIGADENVTKMMFLAICYSANVGGTGTLIGEDDGDGLMKVMMRSW